MKMVLALGMSRPLSMMVVATRMSASLRTKLTIACSSSSSCIWPWPTTICASGTIDCISSAIGVDVVHAVVDEVDLPIAVEFAQDGVADELLVEADDARLDRRAGPAAAFPDC